MLQFLLHMIGDYLLQNDWMAQNKKKKGYVGLLSCLIHCTMYSLPFFIIGNWKQVLAIFVTHFLIDRWFFVKWYMNLVGQKEFAKPPTGPWSIFFVDNTFHFICNFLALTYIG